VFKVCPWLGFERGQVIPCSN